MDVDTPMQSTVGTSAIGANNPGHGGGEGDAVDAVERTGGEADESDTSSNHLPDTRISTSHSDDLDDNTFAFGAVYDDADVEDDDGCMNNLTLGEMQIAIANVNNPSASSSSRVDNALLMLGMAAKLRDGESLLHAGTSGLFTDHR